MGSAETNHQARRIPCRASHHRDGARVNPGSRNQVGTVRLAAVRLRPHAEAVLERRVYLRRKSPYQFRLVSPDLRSSSDRRGSRPMVRRIRAGHRSPGRRSERDQRARCQTLMRIALVTNLYPPIQTGTAHWTQELARHLSRCGYTVTVIACGAASGPMAPPEIDGAAAVYRLPARRLRASRLLLGFDEFYISNTKANRRRIIDILRERRIQIVHQCGHLLDLTYATPLIARELGIPCVCSIHTVIHFPASRLVDALMKTLDRTIVRHFGPGRYDSLIALDAETRGYIEQTYHHPRTRTVLVSIDDDVLQRMPVESDPPPPFRILSIGHVTRMRSRLDLIAAVERLRNRGTRVEMVIVGKLCDPRPVDYVRARGLENIIRFTGELPRAEVFELARTCHMEAHWITVPGLGTATLEAMALGLPVMAWA